jgi:Ferritin-like domain
MADSEQMIGALDARVERRSGRREFFLAAMGAAAVGAGAFAFADAASAQTVTDADILNFALNLEYLEANFYAFAATGAAIDTTLTTGSGTQGTATGGRAVSFTDPVVAQYAKEIAADELAHVKFLRTTIGSVVVAQPAIDVGVSATGAFSAAAQAAGVVAAGAAFDPYASDEAFLLGAYIFEDVGVTAYKGAASLLSQKSFLEAAAGILGVEAYHAATVRNALYRKGIATPSLNLIQNAGKISDARDALDGTTDLDQGIAAVSTTLGMASNISPSDTAGLAFGRSTGQVLNIVYLNRASATLGGFFPAGVNGNIKTSVAN